MFSKNPVYIARLRTTALTAAVAASVLAVQSPAVGCALELSDLKLAGAPLANSSSAGTTQVSGFGVFNTECQAPVGDPPADPGDYPPIDLTGSLNGCWYTYVTASQLNPSGTYKETGSETFVGCFNGLACGTFETVYTFTAKYTDETFAQEIHGRCEHSIVGGTGDFAGAKGVILFKDDVVNLKFDYRGHISLAK